jgi:hypothetical protein
LFDLLDAELSGARAQALTAVLSRFYRSAGSTGYHRATDLVEQALASYGLTPTREEYPLDGQSVFSGGRMPLAWEPLGAELTMVSPRTEQLVTYDEAPSCVIWWSSSTPDGGAAYEVVGVGTGEHEQDYAGKPVDGRVVFIQGTERTDSWESWLRAAQLALARGARGIITDYLLRQARPWRTRESLPRAVQLLRFPPNAGEVWGLSIDHFASQALAEALSRGPVRVVANVQCRKFQGIGVNLTGTIEGRDLAHESVYFCAHVTAGTKPGANCAEGVALATEVARTFQTLIDAGRLPRPRRSLKFLYVAENLGSSYLFHQHPVEADNALLCFNYCSVGHSQTDLHCALMFYRVPDSIPSFVNDFCGALLDETPKETSWVGTQDRQIPLLTVAEVPYIARSDNGIWNAHGVPTPMLMSSPDMYFHTQFLTADKCDPVVFARAGLATAAAAYEVADATAARAIEILMQLRARAAARMSGVIARATRQTLDVPVARSEERREAPYDRAVREIEYLARRDGEGAESVRRLVRHDTRAAQEHVESLVQRVKDDLLRMAEREIDELRAAVGAAVPSPALSACPDAPAKRPAEPTRAAGPRPVPYDRMLALAAEMQRQDPLTNFALLRPVCDEVWSLMAGSRSAREIRDAICVQFDVDLSLDFVEQLIALLESPGA